MILSKDRTFLTAVIFFVLFAAMSGFLFVRLPSTHSLDSELGRVNPSLVNEVHSKPAVELKTSSSQPEVSKAVNRANVQRGVAPAVLSKYDPSTDAKFICLEGASSSLDWSLVNDEFCDCDDGSDEPGT